MLSVSWSSSARRGAPTIRRAGPSATRWPPEQGHAVALGHLAHASSTCQVRWDSPRWFQIRIPRRRSPPPGARRGRSPRRDLPVSHPLASGDQASIPSPEAWQAGTISHSTARATGLTGVVWTPGGKAPNSAMSTAFCSCQPVKLEADGVDLPGARASSRNRKVLKARQRIPGMHLIQVDGLHVQPAQRRSRAQRQCSETARARSGSHRWAALGGQHDNSRLPGRAASQHPMISLARPSAYTSALSTRFPPASANTSSWLTTLPDPSPRRTSAYRARAQTPHAATA